MVLKLTGCLAGDKLCEADHVGFEAIAHLHSQIDDDHDGSLNRAESAEVLTLSSLVPTFIFMNGDNIMSMFH